MPLASTFSTCGVTGMPGRMRCRPSTTTCSPGLDAALHDAHAVDQRAGLDLAELRLAVRRRPRRRTSSSGRCRSRGRARGPRRTALVLSIRSRAARPGVNWPFALSKLARMRIAPVCGLSRLSTKSTWPSCGKPCSLTRPIRTFGASLAGLRSPSAAGRSARCRRSRRRPCSTPAIVVSTDCSLTRLPAVMLARETRPGDRRAHLRVLEVQAGHAQRGLGALDVGLRRARAGASAGRPPASRPPASRAASGARELALGQLGARLGRRRAATARAPPRPRTGAGRS